MEEKRDGQVMILASAGFAKKVTAAAWLLCAVFFFAAPSVHGEQAAPIDAREVQIWNQQGFSPEDAAEWKHVGFSPAEARQWVQAGIPYAHHT